MKRKLIVTAALAVLALGLGTALYLGILPGVATRPAAILAPAAIPVVGGTVQRHDVPIYLRGVGTVLAYNTTVVRSQIQGQLTSITFVEGQTVKAGDQLAQIDPRPYEA